jgi:hypothetical protein
MVAISGFRPPGFAGFAGFSTALAGASIDVGFAAPVVAI